MSYDHKPPQRRSIRLPMYDYTGAGVYFVTLCVHEGECLLGEVIDGEMHRNDAGQAAWECWQAIPEHFAHVQLDAFVVMPNHLHGLIVITDPPRATHASPLHDPAGAAPEPVRSLPHGPPAGSLGAMVGSFKSAASRRINQQRNMPGIPFWQRNYWEHIVRSEEALDRIREYIATNPARWIEDQLHPAAAPNPFNQWRTGHSPVRATHV
jgi:REP element-mobilizing transposase RayT